MKSFSNKQHRSELITQWKEEIDSRYNPGRGLSACSPVKILWWSYFAKHRLAYFVVLTANGMAVDFAWRDACWKSKDFLVKRIHGFGWTL